MNKKKTLTSNMEDYLEAISFLVRKNGIARVKEIGEMLSVKSPSVVSALENLAKKGLIVHERYGYIQMTEKGRKTAGEIEEKHLILSKFLMNILGLDPEIAQEDACKIEHVISQQTQDKLTCFVEFVEQYPDDNKPAWLQSFDHYCKTGKRLNSNKRKEIR